MSEHSQTEFYQSYMVENHSVHFVSHTSWKNGLSKMITTSSYILECFSPIFGLLFENYSSGSYKDWKRMIGLNIGHTIPRKDRYTEISTNWGSDNWIGFRHGPGVRYHCVSTDTIFHLQPISLVHSAEVASSLFQQRGTN